METKLLEILRTAPEWQRHLTSLPRLLGASFDETKALLDALIQKGGVIRYGNGKRHAYRLAL